MKKLNTYELVNIAVVAGVIAVCSWICIPTEIPFTLQTFAVFLAVGLLGGKQGTLAVLTYLLLGIIGLPVFSGFSGGIGWMLGPTGGYIIGFLFSALIMWGMEKMVGRSDIELCLSMIAGLAVCYLFGTIWFVTVYNRQGGRIGIIAALGMCVIPYVIPDFIKIALACLVTRRLEATVKSAKYT